MVRIAFIYLFYYYLLSINYIHYTIVKLKLFVQDVLCSYIEQVICGRRIHIHVIHYDTEPCKEPSVNAPSLSDGGRCGTEEEVVDCLKALSVAGKGRFHHFKVSGTCDGDDITELMEEIDKAIEYLDTGKEILDNYREFCRRVMKVIIC